MRSISSQLPASELFSRQNQQAGAKAGAYIKEQRFDFKERLDAGIVLQTKEGDSVSLSAESFSQMNAYLSDSGGVAASDKNTAAYSMSQREITLASGASFAFSVDGSLSEEELADIETMLKDLDGIISEMKTGDMDEAIGRAMEMGGYDTVSSFTADIRVQQSYEMKSYAAAALTEAVPAGMGPDEAGQISSSIEAGEVGADHDRNHHNYNLFESVFQKVVDQLAQYEDKLLGVAQNPINNLFTHHLEELSNPGSDDSSLFTTLGEMMKQVDSLIDEWLAEADEVKKNTEPPGDQAVTETPGSDEEVHTSLI